MNIVNTFITINIMLIPVYFVIALILSVQSRRNKILDRELEQEMKYKDIKDAVLDLKEIIQTNSISNEVEVEMDEILRYKRDKNGNNVRIIFKGDYKDCFITLNHLEARGIDLQHGEKLKTNEIIFIDSCVKDITNVYEVNKEDIIRELEYQEGTGYKKSQDGYIKLELP